MKILFITSTNSDNLEDGLLHGFRSIFGADCVDFPKKEMMYDNFSAVSADQCYGRLFTLWRTLPDIPVNRTDIEQRVKKGDFDLIIMGSIHRVQPWYKTLLPYLTKRNTIIIDGEDRNALLRHAALRFLYFKRELTPKTGSYFFGRIIPAVLYSRIRLYPSHVQPISFCFPKEKIIAGITPNHKTSLFQSHIVDQEIKDSPMFRQNTHISDKYIFDTEQEYYRDLQQARFGITTKRGGWDCLRHYEIAANGAVQCFRDYSQKPISCAPDGLQHGVNMIEYHNAQDLAEKINSLSDADYESLLHHSYTWIHNQTTEKRAREILDIRHKSLAN